MAVSRAGNLLVLSHPHQAVLSIFNLPSGEFVRDFGVKGRGKGQFNGPCRLAFTQTDTLLVAEHGNERVQEIELLGDGRCIREFAITTPVFAIACSDDAIFAGKRDEDHTDGRVLRIDTTTESVTRTFAPFGKEPGALTDCMGMCVTADGLLAVVDLNTGRITLWSFDGTLVSTVCIPGSNFVDVCELRGGELVAADYTGGRLVIKRRGTEVTAPDTILLGSVLPFAIASHEDMVYVLGNDNCVHMVKYTRA
jgi:DNA-binding beta-propeller fold protein YncE